MSTQSLLVARFSDPRNLVPAAEALEQSDIVESWNAVDGHIDLVAKVTAPPTALLEQIQNLVGIGEMHVMNLSDETGRLLCDPASSHSFVFLEVEHDKLASVREKLSALSQVEFCSAVQGSNQLVGIVGGNTFQSIDRIIDEEIRTIDGVLRVKQDRVIDLKQI